MYMESIIQSKKSQRGLMNTECSHSSMHLEENERPLCNDSQRQIQVDWMAQLMTGSSPHGVMGAVRAKLH